MSKDATRPYNEAKGSKKSKPVIDHYETKTAENDGHIVEHHYKNEGLGEYKRPDVYAFGSGPEMIKHLMDQHGVKEAEMVSHLTGSDESENASEPGGADGGKKGAGGGLKDIDKDND